MTTLVLAACAQEPTDQAKPELSGLEAAVKALQEADNYTFVHSTLATGTPPAGGRAGGRGGPAPDAAASDAAPPPPEPVVLTGHVQKGQPVHFVQGKEQAWRAGERPVVFLETDGSWKPFDRASMRGAFGGRGGRGGAEQEQDAAARAAQQAQREAMRARMGMMRAPLAHQLVSGLAGGVADLKRDAKGGKTVYTGTLTPEGAAAMAGGGQARGGRGGRGGGSMETTGAFTAVVGESGVLESLVVETTTKGSFGDRAFERGNRMELQISKVGETSLEVPAEVSEALKQAAEAAEARPPRERGSEEF